MQIQSMSFKSLLPPLKVGLKQVDFLPQDIHWELCVTPKDDV